MTSIYYPKEFYCHQKCLFVYQLSGPPKKPGHELPLGQDMERQHPAGRVSVGGLSQGDQTVVPLLMLWSIINISGAYIIGAWTWGLNSGLSHQNFISFYSHLLHLRAQTSESLTGTESRLLLMTRSCLSVRGDIISRWDNFCLFLRFHILFSGWLSPDSCELHLSGWVWRWRPS